jgi:tetratricopeptide (TPR) repeat protein
VLNALKEWGERTFEALFGNRSAARMFEAAVLENYSQLNIRIASDNPSILAWPWEALRDPEVGVLGQVCQIERTLNAIRDPQPLPSSLPRNRVNILLVVSRPLGPDDVPSRTIARPLVELIEKERLPVHVELLRPPTFARLRQHLRERPGFYHILHFDGHGSFSAAGDGRVSEGQLIFETDDGNDDAITAEKLSTLLMECAVPGVVLNACQSAMLDPDSEDAFASVATALLRAGMRSVVAMAYSLYVSAAQKFLPGFYRCLFQEGNMARAIRAGRQKMWEDDKRASIRGSYPLQDWLVPVLYQQDPLDLPFSAQGSRCRAVESVSPTTGGQNLREFVGRDSAILQLERALRRLPAGILVQGLGGVGKTSLVSTFVQWLKSTGGLMSDGFWFSFREIRSANYMLNRLGEAILGADFARTAPEKGIDALTAALRKDRHIIVWDNFECAAGIAGSSTSASMSQADRDALADFLDKLRGGATKVLITSRSDEHWLGPHRLFLLRLGGLNAQERWDYCDVLIRDLGLDLDRDDPSLRDLINDLHGHPLAMRIIIPQLERFSAAELRNVLHHKTSKLKADTEEALLLATLELAESSVPEELKPLLTLLAMHRDFFSLPHVKLMAKTAGRDPLDAEKLIQVLSSAGLVTHVGGDMHEMHPMLAGYLSSVMLPTVPADDRESLIRAFISVTASMADKISFMGYREKQQAYYYLAGSLRSAKFEAKHRGLVINFGGLTQCLAALAQNGRDFDSAAKLYEELGAHAKNIRFPQAEASAYHQLGRVAESIGDFVGAEQRYRSALVLYEQAGDLGEVVHTYNSIGICAIHQERLQIAEVAYEKALEILERFQNDSLTAMALHGLGIIAQKRGDLEKAELYYTDCLRLEKERDAIAATYYQLGRVAQEKCEYQKAETWFLKSLQTGGREEIELAGTQYQLAILASQRNDLAAARQWCTSCLFIAEKWNEKHLTADAYNGMGIITMQEGDLAASEQWFQKAITIAEDSKMHRTLVICYRQLGILSGRKGRFINSGQWLIKARRAANHLADTELIDVTSHNFAISCEHATAEERSALASMWREAGFGSLPSTNKKAAEQSAGTLDPSSVLLPS